MSRNSPDERKFAARIEEEQGSAGVVKPQTCTARRSAFVKILPWRNGCVGSLKTEVDLSRCEVDLTSMITIHCFGLSAFAVEIGPLAQLNKARPVERMLAPFALDHIYLKVSHCLAASLALL